MMAATVVGRKRLDERPPNIDLTNNDVSYLPTGLAEQQVRVDKDLATGQGGTFAAVIGLGHSRKENFARFALFGEFQFQIMGKKHFVHLLLLLVNAIGAMPVGSKHGLVAGHHLLGLLVCLLDIERVFVFGGQQIDRILFLSCARLFLRVLHMFIFAAVIFAV